MKQETPFEKEYYYEKIGYIIEEIHKKIVWQKELIEKLLVVVFAWWHALLEWPPGIAKTLSLQSLSFAMNGEFKRIQFTPDLLPSDLIGSTVYRPQTGEFFIKKWPIFANFVLADEINRSPSKVHSALLEAMAEKQVTIWETTYLLPNPFFVFATQNPLEQEGTYRLPEAQLDRFMCKILVPYPTEADEIIIMKEYYKRDHQTITPILEMKDILQIQEYVHYAIFVDDSIYTYIKNIIFFTRNKNNSLYQYLVCPLSPRASLSLLQAAKAHAFLSKRDFVIPEDVKYTAYEVLRHRLFLNYEALAQDITPEEIIETIFQSVPIP